MKKMILWAMVILWMYVIYALSDQPAEQSDRLSRGVMVVIAHCVEHVAPQAELDKAGVHRIVRKHAHFIAFFVLAILLATALYISGVRRWQGLSCAFLVSVLYAITDEWHQEYVPGRSAELTDVLIDSVGTAISLGLFSLTVSAVKQTIHKPYKERNLHACTQSDHSGRRTRHPVSAGHESATEGNVADCG